MAGVGAVGATLAARLTAAGETVSLLARGARLAQLRRDGLQVDLTGGPVDAHLAVSDDPEFGIQDMVFVATKAHGLPALLPTLRPLLGPDTLVAPLVNGIPWWYFQGAGGRFAGQTVQAVDPQGILRGSVPATRIIGCVVYFTSRLQLSGRVSALGGQRMVVGGIMAEAPPAEAPPAAAARADEVATLLAHAGIAATASGRIRDELWTKVALNLATNPLSVFTGATLLEMFTDAKLLPMVSAVIAETAQVAAGHQAQPTMSLEEMIATGRRAGAFETSMLQDYRAGRPLELDAIGYSVLELAQKIGKPMPITTLMVDLCAHRAARPRNLNQ